MKVHSLYIRLRNLLAIALVGLVTASCSDEEIANWNENIQAGLPTTVKLRFNVAVPEEKTSSRVPDENAVLDLYVLIFDANGNRTNEEGDFDDLNNGTTTSQPNTTEGENYVTISTETGPSYIYGIANIASTSNVYSELRGQLDAIENRDQLLDLAVTLDNEIGRVGSTYLMSGIATDEGSDTYTIVKDQDIRTLELRRVESYIKFNLIQGEECTFSPTSYQVFNVPKKTYLIEQEANQTVGTSCTWDGTSGADDYFNTNKLTGNIGSEMSFEFWMVENRKNAKLSIPDNQYALREKQEKISIEGAENKPTVTNGDWVYAPDEGTYVVINGHFEGNSTVEGEGNSGPVEAEVHYTIHLGYVDNDADDFFSNRNTKYTYNVTVNGVNDIILEVIADTPDTEPAPGAEGDVIFTDGTTKFILDAHYETVLLRFNKADLIEGKDKTDFFSYRVTTPFASYLSMGDGSDNGVKDEDWIRFIRNDKSGYGNRTYSTDFQDYASDSNSGTDKRNGMTIAEFIEDLKSIAEDENSDAYDANDEVVYTCHINEFYYDEAPDGVNVQGNLWKKIVNVSPREVQILNDVEVSADGESSITRSTYILSQRSIQTFYNTELSEDYSAYGVETVNETGPLHSWYYYADQVGYSRATNRDNGKENFWGMLNALMGNGHRRDDSWNTYMNTEENGYTDVENIGSVNAMKSSYSDDSNYQRAYLACMQRNRDLDGDGDISEDEIQWYLPAINQYVGMFIGEGALSEESRLYTEDDYVYKHYVTSTISGSSPIIYWAEESVTESRGTEYNMAEYDQAGTYTTYGGTTIAESRNLNHYRCMRNLGDRTPENDHDSHRNNRQLTIPYLAENATRPSTSGELGRHKNDETPSLIYSGGFVYYNGWVTDNATLGDVMYDNTTECYDLSPRGTWRAPNLRELYLMSISDVLDVQNVSEPNVVSRTEFKFSDVPLINTTNTHRIGWFYNGSNLTMGNGSRGEGEHIRCVRDNN